MSETTSSLAPELAAGDQIRFIADHRPQLLDGDYAIDVNIGVGVSQTTSKLASFFPVKIEETTEQHAFAAASHAKFTVTGPRFSIPPTVVHSVFPPARSRGRFGHVLAHVVLDRTTLPWERSATGTNHMPGRLSPPWMALVVFDATKVSGHLRSLTVAELRTAPSIGPPIHIETSDDPTEVVQLLELPWEIAQTVVPDPSEVDWIAHVRDVVKADHKEGESQPVIESATVLSSTRPLMGGRNEVHLVSLEGWYKHGTQGLEWAVEPADSDTVRFVSLHSWDFFCEDEEARSFTDLADGLGRSIELLRMPATSGAAAPYLANGFVALPHQFRHGDQSYSWYHGPLRPGSSAHIVEPQSAPRLPALSADSLLRFDANAGIYNVSYSAAWELGRMLALADRTVGMELNRWRSQRRHHERRAFQQRLHHDLHHHLHQVAATARPEFTLGAWFTMAIDRLSAIPFRYLVADEAMLPRESLRFFDVDPLWLQCARDGAFSVGRKASGDGWPVDEIELMAEAALPPVPELSGILLRSDIVRDYPGLMIDAFAQTEPVSAVRIVHLSPRVIMALYERPIDTVALHLHPQVMHFELRDAHSDGNERDFTRLKTAIIGTGAAHSGALALALLGHTPRREYRRIL